MTLFETWQSYADNTKYTEAEYKAFWTRYFEIERDMYQALLKEEAPVTGTVKELAERFGVEVMTMVGFLDGIDESLVTPNPLDTMDEDTKVSLVYDKEKLYYNMVAARADWLYNLPEWDALLDEETRKELYKKQKSSTTIVKGKKIGRNDPCPCGSGKKYKKCCGK